MLGYSTWRYWIKTGKTYHWDAGWKGKAFWVLHATGQRHTLFDSPYPFHSAPHDISTLHRRTPKRETTTARSGVILRNSRGLRQGTILTVTDTETFTTTTEQKALKASFTLNTMTTVLSDDRNKQLTSLCRECDHLRFRWHILKLFNYAVSKAKFIYNVKWEWSWTENRQRDENTQPWLSGIPAIASTLRKTSKMFGKGRPLSGTALNRGSP
jgi:hypothetical protein